MTKKIDWQNQKQLGYQPEKKKRKLGNPFRGLGRGLKNLGQAIYKHRHELKWLPLAIASYIIYNKVTDKIDKGNDRREGKIQIANVIQEKAPTYLEKGMPENEKTVKIGQYNLVEDMYDSKIKIVEKDSLEDKVDTTYYLAINKDRVAENITNHFPRLSETQEDNMIAVEFRENSADRVSFGMYKDVAAQRATDPTKIPLKSFSTFDQNTNTVLDRTFGNTHYSSQALQSEAFKNFIENSKGPLFLLKVDKSVYYSDTLKSDQNPK